MRAPAPVERFRISKSFPPAGDRIPVRIQSLVPPRRGDGRGVLRALFRVHPVAGNSKAISVAAVGAGIEGRPALLEGEAHLAPGLYDIRPTRGPAAPVRLLLRAGDAPLRVLCRHRTACPSYTEYASIVPPAGAGLGGVFETSRAPCCRRDVLRYMARAENPFDLALIEPLDRPVHLRAEKGVRIVFPGEYLLVDPALPSRLDPSTPFPVHYRAVLFSQAMLRQARDRLDLGREMGPFGFDPAPRPVTPPLRAAVEALAQAAHRQEALGGSWDAALAHQRLFLFLLNGHPNRLKGLWDGRVREDPAEPRVLKAVRHLREHLAEPFDAGETGRAASLSPPHLRHLFRKHLGVSPVRYLQRLRIDAARKLLSAGDRKMDAVARDVGYTDMASLRRVFRRHAQKIPGRFSRRGCPV